MTNIKSYRRLTGPEITQLIERGCSSDDWTLVEVAEAFDCRTINNVEFSGNVRLGVLAGTFTLPGGIRRYSGISHATLHNVTVGDGVYLNNVANYISNYDISDNVLLIMSIVSRLHSILLSALVLKSQSLTR